ncbi:MAG: nucleotide exchange factor GrpE [candidate division WOR-3 bacterium]|nr:nucleotide exchange factor GrpE [candidate division WOR-3 bacterium]
MEKKKTKKELEEEIKTKNKEIKELRNKYLMALADLENYKKRAEKESEEFMKYANERLLKELIPVVDNFERALMVKHSNDDFSKGIELIYKHLLSVLKKEGVEAFESVGKEFNPRYHEAVSVVASKHKDGIVIEELEKGYNLKGKLARPARVVVAQKRR